jgi:hypothetical protein
VHFEPRQSQQSGAVFSVIDISPKSTLNLEGLGLLSPHKGRVAHISLVFREMWDSTSLSL